MSCYNRYRKHKKHGKKRKKKQKQQKRKKRQMPQHTSSRCNTHHLLWQKRYWKTPNAKALREFWYCKVDIPAETIHRYIHEEMVEIPVPPDIACKYALQHLQALDKRGVLHPADSPTKRLGVLICLLGGASRETARALKRQRAIFEEWEKG